MADHSFLVECGSGDRDVAIGLKLPESHGLRGNQASRAERLRPSLRSTVNVFSVTIPPPKFCYMVFPLDMDMMRFIPTVALK